MGTPDRDPRWDALERADPEIVRGLAPHGVRRIEYVAGFPEMTGVAVWLVVGTDAERDAIGLPFETGPGHDGRSAQRLLSDELTDDVAVILRGEAAGLELGEVTGVVQSQEAVVRDFGGSWFNAMR